MSAVSSLDHAVMGANLGYTNLLGLSRGCQRVLHVTGGLGGANADVCDKLIVVTFMNTSKSCCWLHVGWQAETATAVFKLRRLVHEGH